MITEGGDISKDVEPYGHAMKYHIAQLIAGGKSRNYCLKKISCRPELLECNFLLPSGLRLR